MREQFYVKRKRIRKTPFLFLLLVLYSTQATSQHRLDSVFDSRPYIHQLSIEGRPGRIFQTNSFLKGENKNNKSISFIYSTHLKYLFRFRPNSYVSNIYRNVYQGVGVAHYSFGNSDEVGNPLALYLFQGATLAQLSPGLSLSYEWNFGISNRWKPFEITSNDQNKIIGSKVNAYVNANFYFKQELSPQFDFIAGVTFTHFSNGNTQFPNAGLNAVDAKVGLTYKLNGYNKNSLSQKRHIERFPKHISTDVVFFGSKRRKGVAFNKKYANKELVAPGRYYVGGFNINPMYNMGYSLKVGLSLDGVYDSSANIYTKDYIASPDFDPGYTFYKPSRKKQLALGLSARGEYVMPYFTVGVGIGANLLHGGGDLKGLYQILALKIEVTRSSFIHIGYNLQNFKTPNYLMLGLGYRFGNKYPYLY